MTDREALFRAILENPDDDTLRLIYADALEEEGDDRRASFIRAQVRLAAIPEYEPAWFQARYLENDVLSPAVAGEDLPHLPAATLEWAREPFRRGFPAAIETEHASVFVRAADELFKLAPIESLDLAVARLSEAQEFSSCPWRHRVVRLSVTEGFSGPVARKWFGATEYERLRELHIGAGMTTRSTCRAMVRSRVFKHLTVLSSPGSNGLVDELVQLDDPPLLRKLELARNRNRLTAAELRSLVAARVASALEELDLSYNPLGVEGISALATARLPRLRSLNLSATGQDADGIRLLCASDTFAGLRRLTLGYNLLRPAAADQLAGTARAAGLGVLDLSNNWLADEGAFALARSPYLKGLACLDLSSNEIGDAGATALLDSPHLTGLLLLNLSFNEISAEVQERLRERFGAGVIS